LGKSEKIIDSKVLYIGWDMWICLDFEVLRPQELRRKLELGIEELTRASIEDGGAEG